MAANFLIHCRVGPLGAAGPLLPSVSRGPFGRQLVLMQPEELWRPCPRGFGIDARMEFDLQEDGGVDRIEVWEKLGGSLVPGLVRPRAGETYVRLFVEPGERSLGNPNSNFTCERVGETAQLRFSDGAAEGRYLVGPGVTALLGAGALRGIDVDLRKFIDGKSV